VGFDGRLAPEIVLWIQRIVNHHLHGSAAAVRNRLADRLATIISCRTKNSPVETTGSVVEFNGCNPRAMVLLYQAAAIFFHHDLDLWMVRRNGTCEEFSESTLERRIPETLQPQCT
jgi:hypothetical protein